MSRTIIQHPDGSTTTIRKTSGCGGCFWALLGAFLLFAPAAWIANGSIPAVLGVGLYVALAVVLVAGLAQAARRRAQ